MTTVYLGLACCRFHGCGAFHENRTLGTVNVESVGGHLLVHHYLAATSAPGHLVMHSRNTRVYVMHFVPITIEGIWTLDVQRRDSKSALFRCTVETPMPMLFTLFATLGLLPPFLRRHVRGETPLFAKDIARMIGGGALNNVR